MIDAEAGKKCLSFESPISWNREGPKGDPGEPGVGGSLTTVTRVGQLAQGVSLAHCQIGEVATGGGGQATGAGPALSHSFPLSGVAGTTPTGWVARTNNPEGFVQAYAVCVDPGT